MAVICYNPLGTKKKEMYKQMENQLPKTKKFDYTWVIIILCFLSIFVSMGLCAGGKTMYLTAVTDALGIPRGAFSLNDTFRYVTTTIVNLFFGTLMLRFGAKKLMCAGFICLIAFALICSVATSLIAFYVAGVLLGLGLAWTGTPMVSAVINRWCTKNKGAITGAILAANGVGGAAAIQILSPIIFEEGNPFGYRNSYKLVALILAITLVIILLFFRNSPKGSTAEPVAAGKKHKVRGAGWVGMEFSEVKKKKYFYVTVFCMFLIGISLQGISGMTAPHMYDMGLSTGYVATLLSVSGILLTCTKFICGFMFDRKGLKLTMNICLLCAFVALAALVCVNNTPFGRTVAAVRIVFGAIALPLETVMLPLFASDLFGNKSFEKNMGLFSSASYAGFALGAPAANLFYDIFGNYNLPFIICAVLMLFVTIAMQFVLKSAHKDRDIILASLKEKGKETVNA